MNDQTFPGNLLSINSDFAISVQVISFNIRQYVQRKLSVLKITICALATFGRTVIYIFSDETQNVFTSRSALNGQRGCFLFGFMKFEKRKRTRNENEMKNSQLSKSDFRITRNKDEVTKKIL